MDMYHSGYCSWCFNDTKHELQEHNIFRRSVYRCSCGQRTLICRAPGCRNMARGRGTNNWDNEFCAAHGGEIGGFRHLSMQLEHIEDYERLFKREVVNIGKIATIAGAVLGGTVLVCPLALLSAPAVGGALGATFFELSGAAATAKGLATLGLGSLAAGGYGMAGGIAVVSAMGAAAGGVYSGIVANAYFGDIQGFKISKLKTGSGPGVIVINGFLTQDKNQEREWLDVLSQHYPKNPWYLVEWESKRLVELGKLAISTGSKEAFRKAVKGAALKATQETSKKLNPIAAAFSALGLASNSWHVAMVKAAQTGVLLADILARTPIEQEFVLMGHSLGARVVYYALQALNGRKPRKIRTAHLFGGAVGSEPAEDWNKAASALFGPLHSYYSLNDQVLKILYLVGTFFLSSPPIGRTPIQSEDVSICNHNVTNSVDSHGKFKAVAAQYLHV